MWRAENAAPERREVRRRDTGALVPNITMLEVDDLLQGELAGFVKKCLKHKAPDPAFHTMQGHNPALSAKLYVAWGTVFNSGVVSHSLKEIIRVQLSRAAFCNY